MKLSVEIVDKKFLYSYQVGESKQTGEMHLSADLLVLFSGLLQQCSGAFKHADKEWEREAIAKAWLEKNK